MDKAKLIQEIKEICSEVDFRPALQKLIGTLKTHLPDPLPELSFYPLVLIGGGSGTPVVGSSLYAQGMKNFVMIGNPTDTLRDKETRQTVGAGILKEEFGAPDWVDITKQLLHATPKDEWGELRQLLESKPWPAMRVAYLVLEALRQITNDVQTSINVLGQWLGNTYEVIPSTTKATEAMFLKGGRKHNLYEFALNGLSFPDKIELEPPASLNPSAKTALEKAHYLIVGPGDVHFSVLPHFYVQGFPEALSLSPGKIILITNLTARPIDIPGFKLSDLLDLFAKYLPHQETIVLVHQGAFPEVVEHKLEDDVSGNARNNFQLIRKDVASDQLNNNKQLVHDPQKLGSVLNSFLKT